MSETTILKLVKPDHSDNYSLNVINSNTDKIEAYASNTNTTISDLTNRVEVLTEFRNALKDILKKAIIITDVKTAGIDPEDDTKYKLELDLLYEGRTVNVNESVIFPDTFVNINKTIDDNVITVARLETGNIIKFNYPVSSGGNWSYMHDGKDSYNDISSLWLSTVNTIRGIIPDDSEIRRLIETINSTIGDWANDNENDINTEVSLLIDTISTINDSINAINLSITNINNTIRDISDNIGIWDSNHDDTIDNTVSEIESNISDITDTIGNWSNSHNDDIALTMSTTETNVTNINTTIGEWDNRYESSDITNTVYGIDQSLESLSNEFNKHQNAVDMYNIIDTDNAYTKLLVLNRGEYNSLYYRPHDIKHGTIIRARYSGTSISSTIPQPTLLKIEFDDHDTMINPIVEYDTVSRMGNNNYLTQRICIDYYEIITLMFDAAFGFWIIIDSIKKPVQPCLGVVCGGADISNYGSDTLGPRERDIVNNGLHFIYLPGGVAYNSNKPHNIYRNVNEMLQDAVNTAVALGVPLYLYPITLGSNFGIGGYDINTNITVNGDLEIIGLSPLKTNIVFLNTSSWNISTNGNLIFRNIRFITSAGHNRSNLITYTPSTSLTQKYSTGRLEFYDCDIDMGYNSFGEHVSYSPSVGGGGLSASDFDEYGIYKNGSLFNGFTHITFDNSFIGLGISSLLSSDFAIFETDNLSVNNSTIALQAFYNSDCISKTSIIRGNSRCVNSELYIQNSNYGDAGDIINSTIHSDNNYTMSHSSFSICIRCRIDTDNLGRGYTAYYLDGTELNVGTISPGVAFYNINDGKYYYVDTGAGAYYFRQLSQYDLNFSRLFLSYKDDITFTGNKVYADKTMINLCGTISNNTFINGTNILLHGECVLSNNIFKSYEAGMLYVDSPDGASTIMNRVLVNNLFNKTPSINNVTNIDSKIVDNIDDYTNYPYHLVYKLPDTGVEGVRYITLNDKYSFSEYIWDGTEYANNNSTARCVLNGIYYINEFDEKDPYIKGKFMSPYNGYYLNTYAIYNETDKYFHAYQYNNGEQVDVSFKYMKFVYVDTLNQKVNTDADKIFIVNDNGTYKFISYFTGHNYSIVIHNEDVTEYFENDWYYKLRIIESESDMSDTDMVYIILPSQPSRLSSSSADYLIEWNDPVKVMRYIDSSWTDITFTDKSFYRLFNVAPMYTSNEIAQAEIDSYMSFDSSALGTIYVMHPTLVKYKGDLNTMSTHRFYYSDQSTLLKSYSYISITRDVDSVHFPGNWVVIDNDNIPIKAYSYEIVDNIPVKVDNAQLLNWIIATHEFTSDTDNEFIESLENDMTNRDISNLKLYRFRNLGYNYEAYETSLAGDIYSTDDELPDPSTSNYIIVVDWDTGHAVQYYSDGTTWQNTNTSIRLVAPTTLDPIGELMDVLYNEKFLYEYNLTDKRFYRHGLTINTSSFNSDWHLTEYKGNDYFNLTDDAISCTSHNFSLY